jgi:hypothetical protein
MICLRNIFVSAVVVLGTGIEILLDDAGKHMHLGNVWTKAAGECAEAGHAGGFHHNNGVHNEDSFATWNFSVATDGCYWVEEFHPDTSKCDFHLAPRVPLVIHFCKGLQTAGVIDQQQHAGQWNKLVKLPFYVNWTAAIVMSARGMPFNASGVWAADAFRLTWDSESCHEQDAEQDEAVAPTEEAVSVAATQERMPFLQAQVDDSSSKVLATAELIPQCPATAGKTFHHDAMQKERRAEATFHFDPPHDGCYLIEEMHPDLGGECKASNSTKVHVNYCKGLKAVGTVDQSVKAGQWTYLAALPFYAGHSGNVTLSNEGTEPGTLTVFDKVRFTWSGKSCSKVQAHPRHAEIRLTVDFKNVANRLPEFGSALKSKIAVLASVPETSLRLTDLRSGSIIARFLVLPSVVDDPLASQIDSYEAVGKLRSAIEKNAADLCALTGASLEGCNVEFTDLGVARPSVRPMPRARPQEQEQETEEETEPDTGFNPITVIVFVAAFGVLKLAICFFMVKSGKTKHEAYMKEEGATKTAETEVTVSMEEGKAVETVKDQQDGKAVDDNKRGEEEVDNTSTLAPSSDKQSEPSLNGDVEEDKKSDLSILKALSQQDI